MNFITISGAKEHNLKNLNLKLPKNKIIVFTGLSGSGKSSLAFDTIYAEGQRRYVESLSAYARQFLEQMDKPDVEHIEGLSPAIAIGQHSPSKNPRSTVGTVTEIYDYLRLLFAKIGNPQCPICKLTIKQWPLNAIVKEILSKYDNQKIKVLSPLIKDRIGTYEELFLKLKKAGFVKVKIDNKFYELKNPPKLQKYAKHTIELFIDELTVCRDEKERLQESLELAMKQSQGYAGCRVTDYVHQNGQGYAVHQNGQGYVSIEIKDNSVIYSDKNSCPACGISFPELEPRLFSFNSPHGACPKCAGLGIKIEIDENLVIPATEKNILEGAIEPWNKPITTKTHRWKNSWSSYYGDLIENICAARKIPINIPWKNLSKVQKSILLYGDDSNDFEGIITNLKRRYLQSQSDYVKEEIYRKYMHERKCSDCDGKRLKPEGLNVFINGKNIAEVSALSIEDIIKFTANLQLSEKDKFISRQILKEINSRLNFLINVGLSYISLERKSRTLSGGEAQRIQLATQIGSGLTGVLYVLDEPTIGLHQSDNARLIHTLKSLRDLGNTLIIVEHDEAIIRNADYIVDLGPKAGSNGGYITAQGSLNEILSNPKSLTGKFLKRERITALKQKPIKAPAKFLKFEKAAQFNLKNINVKIPIGLFTCICGISGSGKSTLLYEIVYKALAKKIYKSKENPGKFEKMSGCEFIDKVIIIDQAPIGRTPRSNPATYTGLFAHIRELFAQIPESKRRGYKSGRFSFNVSGGRCEACAGEGTIKIQMQFLSDIYVKCDECHGKRFTDSTLEVRLKNKNISEVLDMTADEAKIFFKNIPQILKILNTLCAVGLGYIKLGQSATTLSGGEAQRMKLAYQLSKRSTGKTLYILDEPTTGLHFADTGKLLKVLRKLNEQGNTILIIEHNLDVIASSDWIIELGPEGGEKGGYQIFAGATDKMLKAPKSITAPYLKKHIGTTVIQNEKK
ncbi:MAG: excinuclease ABC subunit UvrA [Elusimicrobia bacterium]|nr:excinuclease ABC subunit UvrA [Elusimicrobiota bacterium]